MTTENNKHLRRSVQLQDVHKTRRIVYIYKIDDSDEYVCELEINGMHYEPADYFTDDYDDAVSTSMVMCRNA